MEMAGQPIFMQLLQPMHLSVFTFSGVKEGGDRQELHEKIRQLSMEAGRNVKVNGLDNNLLDLIAADDTFHLTKEQLQQCMNPERYTGRSKEQVEDFLAEVINPILAKNKEDLGMTAEINV